MRLVPGSGAGDRELAAAVLRTGDERAFRTLYRRHTPRAYGVVLRLLGGDVHGAEDVVQEAWLRAVGGLDRFRWESAFGTWIVGIAVHVAHDALRKRSRGREDGWDETVDVAAPVAAIGERIDLERAIARLPDGYRSVLVLHDVEGWPHEDIGSLFGISPGTSKSQLHRARRALRAWLAPEPETENA
jgi:RNA polymerase sigma-70 factor (ECF subfamily)